MNEIAKKEISTGCAFKVGDKVRCVDANNYPYIGKPWALELNAVYTILEVKDGIGTLYLKEIPHQPTNANRFELAYEQMFKNKLEILINE